MGRVDNLNKRKAISLNRKYKQSDLFTGYMKNKFPTLNHFFYPWDLSTIEEETDQWLAKTDLLIVYVYSKGNNESNAYADIGCTKNVKKRLEEKNQKTNFKNELLIALYLPPYRNYSSKNIKADCKKGRGWKSKCEKSLQLALERGLKFKISKKIIDKDSNFYIPKLDTLLDNPRYKNIKEKNIFFS